MKEGETKTIEAAVEQPLEDINNNEKKVSKTKRGRPARSQCNLLDKCLFFLSSTITIFCVKRSCLLFAAMGPTTSRPAVSKEIVENKRSVGCLDL